ncbi:MAG: S1 RNA-binding domain-containing protein [Lactococcus raffinolactis]|uniref:CvfB family protein n=1 Tax=Pseudolactococcus raffinolactis TaxID=1366 RepID=UPI00399644E9
MTDLNAIMATRITGKITDENDQNYYIQKDGLIFRLPKTEGDFTIGDDVTGFAYTDKAGKQRLTLTEPSATRDTYGWGTVTDVRKDLGVFLDVNIPEKDVVVSVDILPELKELWPKKGDKLYVKLDVGNKDRIWGELAYPETFVQMAGKAYDNMQNQNLHAIVYRNKLSGSFVYLPENNMLGFIHPNERFSEPRLGQELDVRVIGYREIDKTLNLSLKPRSYEMLDADAQLIMTYLEQQGGHMPFYDKSAPEDIKATFAISKGQFKKALGGLMKQGKIKQDETGTTLL